MKDDRKCSQAQINAALKYSAKTYKRIPLDVKKNAAEILKEHCSEINTGVNTYIKEAIKEKYLRDTGKDIDL